MRLTANFGFVALALALAGCPGPSDTETDTDPGTDPDTDTAAGPAAPTQLVATPGDGQIRLDWRPPQDAAGYIVQRGGSAGGPYDEIGRAAVPRFTDTDLTNGDTWYYVVIAANAAGESPPSAEVAATVGAGG